MMRRLALLLLALYGATAVGAELGRLFFTPAQRATLDNARKQNVRTEIGNDNPDAASSALPQNIIVNGLVRRSDGKNTVWVNNRPITERQSSGVDVVTDRNANRVKLTVPDSGHSVDLKVGQTLDLDSGAVEEGYSRHAVVPPAGQENAGAGATTHAPAAAPATKTGAGTVGPAAAPRGDSGTEPAAGDSAPK